MSGSDDATGFVATDQNPRFFINFLDARRTMAGEREIKQLILDQLELRCGSHVLDIGCGVGDDAREIAGLVAPSGRVTAIDHSEAMIKEAKTRAPALPMLDFRQGDALHLELPSESFDAVRTDRSLTFVPDIARALAEAFRVLRPGGRIATSELDMEAQFMDSPHPDVAHKFMVAFARSIPQPRLGRQLARLLRETGFRDVSTKANLVQAPVAMFDRVYGGFLKSCVEKGVLSTNEQELLESGAREVGRSSNFLVCFAIFTASGRKY